MPDTLLPRNADLRKLAAAGARLGGAVPLSMLGRLGSALLSTDGAATVEMELRIDDEQRRLVSGTVRADLRCTCQRCLGEMCIDIDAAFVLAMVWDEEQLAALPAQLDGVVVGEGAADTYELVEDELLLAVPFAPRHPEGQCVPPAAAVQGEQSGIGDEQENVFAQVLAGLKTDDA